MTNIVVSFQLLLRKVEVLELIAHSYLYKGRSERSEV